MSAVVVNELEVVPGATTGEPPPPPAPPPPPTAASLALALERAMSTAHERSARLDDD